MTKPLLLLTFSLLFLSAFSKTAEEWKTRTIYQMLTDRFARTDGSTTPCDDLGKYCGGTFKGIEKNLDYIQNLGANAIWISPTSVNAPGAYHGYAITDLFGINQNFGTEQDLKDLVQACHERDIYVMVDVVPNHMANIERGPENNDFSNIIPFNDKSHYHWPVFPCKWIDDNDPTNQTALERCWLWGLPDLDHDNPIVRNTLLDWVKDLVTRFDLDGLRIDAVRHVDVQFWQEFTKAAGVFTVGEVFNNDTSYVSKYQAYMDSLLNFPFYKELMKGFHQGASLTSISEYYKEAKASWNDLTAVANFMGNHDLVRFLHENPDVAGLKAAQAFVLCTVGIPVIYCGDEQSFNGGDDPLNREPLWTSMNTESDMYQYIKKLAEFRKKTQFYRMDQVERDVDDHYYSFTRGPVYFAFTNSMDEIKRDITNHGYEDGTVLCNLFSEKPCETVVKGSFKLHMKDKEVKILFPLNPEDKNNVGSVKDGLKNILANALASGKTQGSEL